VRNYRRYPIIRINLIIADDFIVDNICCRRNPKPVPIVQILNAKKPKKANANPKKTQMVAIPKNQKKNLTKKYSKNPKNQKN
jgi:uncharacterized protein YcsI (UPF0317 family)